jgi:hypothetical protein
LIGFLAAGAGVLFAWVTAAGIDLAPFAAGGRFRLDDLLGTSFRADGILVAVCVMAGFGTIALSRRFAASRFRALTGGFAALVLAVAVLQFEMIARADRVLGGLVSPGIGLWLVTGGALAAMAGAFVAGRQASS